jgi:hypothetical protein
MLIKINNNVKFIKHIVLETCYLNQLFILKFLI